MRKKHLIEELSSSQKSKTFENLKSYPQEQVSMSPFLFVPTLSKTHTGHVIVVCVVYGVSCGYKKRGMLAAIV